MFGEQLVGWLFTDTMIMGGIACGLFYLILLTQFRAVRKVATVALCIVKTAVTIAAFFLGTFFGICIGYLISDEWRAFLQQYVGMFAMAAAACILFRDYKVQTRVVYAGLFTTTWVLAAGFNFLVSEWFHVPPPFGRFSLLFVLPRLVTCLVLVGVLKLFNIDKYEGNSNYGVYSSGGTITATDCTITMTGTGSGRNDNFGIYSTLQEGSTGGTATANGCTITINGTYSAGVLSMGGTLNVGASSITVDFTGNSLSSAGVSSEGGKINLTGNTTITSDGLGITARGEINVDSGTTTVDTERGTGIYVQNGTLTVAEGATVKVDSKIDDSCSWVVPPEHEDEGEPLNTNKYNGVFVNGGSLVAEGTLNVTFKGVENDAQDETQYNTYLTQQIKSYAVRVEAASGSETKVTIASGSITNSIGGGVYVGSGTVTLGDETTKTGPTVTTTGNSVASHSINWWQETTNGHIQVQLPDGSYADGTWNYSWNLTGGDAIKVVGGNLTVYGGSYEAKQGNGILVSGASATAIVESGTFKGNDNYKNQDDNAMPGAAASYGLKMFGGKLTINEGSFTGGGSGAFIMGASDNRTRANAVIKGGEFKVTGTAGLSVWYGADVKIGTENATSGPEFVGNSAGMTVETYPEYNEQFMDSIITIYSGTFTGTTQDGIWYGGAQTYLYIYGGTMTGPRAEINAANGSRIFDYR